MGGGASTTQPLSPHSSPPLSASLASSEGSMRAFLLQSGPPSGQPSQDQIREMKNLQVIVNQGEERSGVNSSEETTPDGTTRSLNSLNHSE